MQRIFSKKRINPEGIVFQLNFKQDIVSIFLDSSKNHYLGSANFKF